MNVVQAMGVLSLRIAIDVCDAGWIVTAPWLAEPLIGPRWEPLYYEAVAKKNAQENAG